MPSQSANDIVNALFAGQKDLSDYVDTQMKSLAMDSIEDMKKRLGKQCLLHRKMDQNPQSNLLMQFHLIKPRNPQMKLITEQIDDAQVVITEGKNGKKQTFIEGVFLQGEITNRNGRRYPIQTLAREAATYNEKFIKTGRALGELGHPEGPTINLDRASHIITSLKQEGNNFVGKQDY
ncbi:MAG: hypothetical protein CM15mL1_0150 [Libanvirus sp.]|nr:MAG: hypothetical protein CM15mL1_0150 [Libanvirus sp.]